MASASPPAASKQSSKSSPLVCAPCYICLEDGPDEEGKPLIRECSCRGESSAGYHLSCIINYAKAKTKEAVEEYDADGEEWEYFDDHWFECANCKQEYEEGLCTELAKEMVAYVASLVSDPETHYLHFEARRIMTNFLPSKAAQEEITSLLRLLEERKGDIARSWHELRLFGERDQTIFLTEKKDSLLSSLGIAHLKERNAEKTIETWEQRLVTNKTLKSLVSDPNKEKAVEVVVNDYDPKEDDIDSTIKCIEKQIRHLADLKGSASDREKELRSEIEAFAGNNDHQSANTYKRYLANILLRQEPPQYQEAIGLLEEASDLLERILGPGRKEVGEVKFDLAEAKQKYEKHLASNDGGKRGHAGSKRKRDDGK